MEKVEEINDKQAKNTKKHTSIGIIITVLVLVAVIEFIAGGFLYLKFSEKEQDMNDREDLLYRQAASIEFKQIGVNKDKAQLEAYEAELTKLEIELKVKEDQFKEQKKLLDSFRSSIKDTVSILEPKKIAENMFNTYLEKYSRVDLTIPMPCEPTARAEYNAAKMHLEALLTAGQEVSKDNKYINFVSEQKKLMSTAQVDCGDEANIAYSDNYSGDQDVSSAQTTSTLTSDEDESDDEYAEEYEEETMGEDEIEDDNQDVSRVDVKLNLDDDMKRRDSAFKSLED